MPYYSRGEALQALLQPAGQALGAGIGGMFQGLTAGRQARAQRQLVGLQLTGGTVSPFLAGYLGIPLGTKIPSPLEQEKQKLQYGLYKTALASGARPSAGSALEKALGGEVTFPPESLDIYREERAKLIQPQIEYYNEKARWLKNLNDLYETTEDPEEKKSILSISRRIFESIFGPRETTMGAGFPLTPEEDTMGLFYPTK